MYIYNYSFSVIVVIDSIYIPYHFPQYLVIDISDLSLASTLISFPSYLEQSHDLGGCWVTFQPQGGSPHPFSQANRVYTFAVCSRQNRI